MSLLIKDKKFAKAHPKLRPIAIVKGGKHDKKLVLFNEDPDQGFDSITLDTKSGKLQALPNFNKNEKLYIAGNSGAGKSYYIAQWIKEWKKHGDNKEKPIYIFSSVDEDETLDSLENVERIPIDETLVSEPIKPEDLSDSICIMDDIDTISHPTLRKIVINFRNHLAQCARHYNITMLCTSHVITNYSHTRVLIQEATSITVFPKASGLFAIRQYLEKQVGMNKDQIKRFVGQKSRAVTLFRQYQPYIMSEKEVYMLRDNDE